MQQAAAKIQVDASMTTEKVIIRRKPAKPGEAASEPPPAANPAEPPKKRHPSLQVIVDYILDKKARRIKPEDQAARLQELLVHFHKLDRMINATNDPARIEAFTKIKKTLLKCKVPIWKQS